MESLGLPRRGASEPVRGSPTLGPVRDLYSVVDLFAGCGGLTAGFTAAGFVAAGAVEHDVSAAATYAANFGDHVTVAELEDWVVGSAPRAEVVVGGPPCQGFSLLGKQCSDDPRNLLWRSYVDSVRKIRPAFFVLENVPQFLASEEFSALKSEVHSGELRDYSIESFVLSADDYGVAQKRRRAFVIGRLRGLRPIGEPEKSAPKNLEDVFPAWLTPRLEYTALPDRRTLIGEATVSGPFKLPELHFGRRPSPLALSRYDAVPPGGSRLDLPDHLQMRCWREAPNSAGDVLGRLSWNSPSVTIRTEFFKPEKGRFLHPTESRALTHAEAALIQGFSDDFVWFGSSADIARQIGNAVPPPMAAAVASRLRSRLV